MKIGEISFCTGISESTLRYYEKKKLIRVNRDVNGHRNYLESDIEWIKFIQRLKNTGMMLCDIQKYSELRYQGDSTLQQRLLILKNHRQIIKKEIIKWNEYLRNLDEKIEIYECKVQNDI